jgi:(R,R)-butanediol dehydrogenase/meso-butanediol dehydrogenase/diacetyl reductase
MMKAAFYERDQKISVRQIEATPPGPGEVQVQVAYSGICGTDLHIYHGVMDTRVAPAQIMGHEISGTVSALGEGVSEINIGDAVTVMPLDPCGKCPACLAGNWHVCLNLNFLGIDTPGGFQTYWNVPSHTILHLPEGMSMELGALIEPLAVACHDVRLGKIVPGENVVVLGGGPIGTLNALVAQHAGAKVLVSEINPTRVKVGQELGLDVVNPNQVDLVALVNERTGGAGADAVFEVTSHASGAEMMTKLPRVRGRIILVGIFGTPPVVDLKAILWREMVVIGARVYEREDFQKAINLAASGELPLTGIISKILPLSQLKEGLELLAGGGNVMKVLIQCS